MAFPPQPRTPASALALFLLGCVAIGWTSLDVARRVRENEAPLSAEQLAALQGFKEDLDAQARARRGEK